MKTTFAWLTDWLDSTAQAHAAAGRRTRHGGAGVPTNLFSGYMIFGCCRD